MATTSEFGNWQVALDEILDSMENAKIFKIFSNLTSNESRVKFIFRENLLKRVKWLPLYFDACKSWHGKSLEVAQVWKNKGNKFFQQKKYLEAVDAYTQSCLNAPTESGVDLALSFGNRSAALFHLGHYQQCLIDIKRALSLRFPPDSCHKLLARKVSALVKLGQKAEAEQSFQLLKDFVHSEQFNLHGTKKDDFLKEIESLGKSIKNMGKTAEGSTEDSKCPVLSFGRNSVVSQASDAVTLKFTCDKGRHLLAKQRIPKGSTVIVERPFAAVLLPEHYETHCHHCFRPLPLTSLGCTRCSWVRFCDETCREAGWSSYHRTECPYLNLFHSIGIAHLSLRIVLCAGLDFLTDFVKRESTFRQSDELSAKGINSDGLYDRSYLTVYDLMTHEENTLSQDMLQYSLTAALLLSTLVHAGFFRRVQDSGDSLEVINGLDCLSIGTKYQEDSTGDVNIVGGLLLRHILQLVCNAHAITSVEQTPAQHRDELKKKGTQTTEQVRIATAIYPTASLMNHSCDPTIISSFIGNILVVKTVKDVEEGEEIFNCYGPHYCRMSQEQRQEVLKSQYHFDCQCPPCCRGDKSHLRFNAWRCPVCAGVLSGRFCLECNSQIDEKTSGELWQISEQANQLFREAVKLMNADQHSDAIQVLMECQDLRRQVLHRDHKDLAMLEDSLAQCYANLEDFNSSADHLLTSVQFTELMYGKDSIELANELQKLAEVLFNAERLTECLEVANQSCSLFESLYTADHEATLQIKALREAAVQALTPMMQQINL